MRRPGERCPGAASSFWTEGVNEVADGAVEGRAIGQSRDVGGAINSGARGCGALQPCAQCAYRAGVHSAPLARNGAVRYGTVRCRMAHIVYVALTSMGVECCGPTRYSPTLRDAHCARRVGDNGRGMMRVGTVRFVVVNAHCVLGDGAICFGRAYLAWMGWAGDLMHSAV